MIVETAIMPLFAKKHRTASLNDNIRSFEKGLADRGGWREEILQRPEIQASFLYPFSYAHLGERGHISGELFGLFLGVCLSPTPSRQPLFETSDNRKSTLQSTPKASRFFGQRSLSTLVDRDLTQGLTKAIFLLSSRLNLSS